MQGFWIAVASAEHVRHGREGGFMQVCHGKGGPLRRIRPGDGVAYYSPTTRFGGKDRLQCFTAIGTVDEGEPYLAEMGGFHPWRRSVIWEAGENAAIRPLLDRLSFAAGRPNWGAALRFGLLAIEPADFRVIAQAMSATVPGAADRESPPADRAA